MELQPLNEPRVEPSIEDNVRRKMTWRWLRGIFIVLIFIGIVAIGWYQLSESNGRHRRAAEMKITEGREPYKMACIPPGQDPCIAPVDDFRRIRVINYCGYLPIMDNTSVEITNAERMAWNEGPWSAALIISKEGKPPLKCSATVISNQHLLVSAHCFVDSDTGRMMTELEHLSIYYGRSCVLIIPFICPEEMPETEKYAIKGVAFPQDFDYRLTVDDYAIVETVDSMPINARNRPICYAKWTVKDVDDKKEFIKTYCRDYEQLTVAGYSGTDPNESWRNSGLLRKFKAVWGGPTPKDTDYILVKSVPKASTPERIPLIVNGDSGGPAVCRLKEEFSPGKDRYLLVAITQEIERGTRRYDGFFKAAFVPQHGDGIICEKTNACWNPPKRVNL